MTFEMWLTFAIASAAILATPGPTVTLAVSYALGGGRRAVWVTVLGATLGDFTAMTLSLLGAGAILTASATLFSILKVLGAIYLIWLGVQLYRTDPGSSGSDQPATSTSGRQMFRNAFSVTALHPGGFVFFISFVPQFVNPDLPSLPQFVLLEATFLFLVATIISLWALSAVMLRRHFYKPPIRKLFNRTGGSILIASGLFAMFSDKRI